MSWRQLVMVCEDVLSEMCRSECFWRQDTQVDTTETISWCFATIIHTLEIVWKRLFHMRQPGLGQSRPQGEAFKLGLARPSVWVCRLLALISASLIQINSTLTLSPLSSHSRRSPDPELPDTTLFVTVFPKFSSRYFVFTGINQRSAGRYFSFTGICNGRRSRFFGVTGWEGYYCIVEWIRTVSSTYKLLHELSLLASIVFRFFLPQWSRKCFFQSLA